MRYAIVLLLSAALVPSVSLAAETPELAKGVRVRLSAPSVHAHRLTGVLVDATTDSVTIDPDQGSAGLTIPRRDLDQLEVSTGLRGNTLKGAGIGLAVGAGTGAAMGATMEPGIAGMSGNIVVGSVLIGAVGLAFGTIAGTLYRSEGWMRLSTNAPTGGGVQGYLPAPAIRIALTVGF